MAILEGQWHGPVATAEPAEDPLDDHIRVGDIVRIEHGKNQGKQGEIVIIDSHKVVLIVPERGHRHAKRLVLMAAAQPERGQWALSKIAPLLPPPPPPPRESGSKPSRPGKGTRPRWNSSPRVPKKPPTSHEHEARAVSPQLDPTSPGRRRGASPARVRSRSPGAGEHSAADGSAPADLFFTALDVDGDGVITHQEMTEAFAGGSAVHHEPEAEQQHTAGLRREPRHPADRSARVYGGRGAAQWAPAADAAAGGEAGLAAELQAWGAQSQRLLGLLRTVGAEAGAADGQGSQDPTDAVRRGRTRREVQALVMCLSEAVDRAHGFQDWLGSGGGGGGGGGGSGSPQAQLAHQSIDRQPQPQISPIPRASPPGGGRQGVGFASPSRLSGIPQQEQATPSPVEASDDALVTNVAAATAS